MGLPRHENLESAVKQRMDHPSSDQSAQRHVFNDETIKSIEAAASKTKTVVVNGKPVQATIMVRQLEGCWSLMKRVFA